MQQYDNLDAIHIVSHGDVGELSLGSTKLNQNTLNSYANGLITWRDSITDNGDILLYGCNVAEGAVGEEFVEDLSQYTAADVLASVDLTGSEDFGGDWDLEFATGNIEEDLAFDAEIKSSYQHTLVDAEFTVISTRPDDGFIVNDGFNDRFNERFNDQIDREVFGSGDDDEVDASDYSSFANVPADNLVNLARNGLNFAEVSPDTLATIDFNNIPAEDFQILKDAGLSLIPLSFEALSNVNLGVLKNFDYLSQVNLSQTRFNNLTVFGQLSATFVSNANLYDYKADLKIDSGLNLGKIAQLSLSDFQAIDYAFDGDEIFDSVHYTALRKTLNGTNPYTDYVQNGWKLGLDPHPLFDTSYYLARNTDVIDDGAEPLKHYITTGYTDPNPNRDPHPLFDTSYYQDSNTDVVNANKNPLLHYIENGLTENFDSRDPNRFFDSSYYNANNPKVVEARMNPLVHYLQFGWQESRRDNPGGFNPNRDPSPFFDTSYYFDKNIDVLEASYTLDSANPVQHALEFVGINGLYANEDRATHPTFDSPNQVAYTITITADSPGFEFAQDKFREVDIELTSRENGIEVAGVFLAPLAAPLVIEAIKLTITVGTLYLLRDKLEDAAEGVIDIYQAVADSAAYQTLSISRDDIITGTPPFPDDTVESPPIIESFPRGNTSEDLFGFDGRFYTPIESIEEANDVTTFPQRDEALEDILNGGLFLGGEETPQGVYFVEISYDPTDPFYEGATFDPNNDREPTISASSFEDARNIALERLGKIDPSTRKPYVGRVRSGIGNIVGFTTIVDGTYKRYRLDYDDKKGPHINIDTGRKTKQKKLAIEFPGTEADYKQLLEELQR